MIFGHPTLSSSRPLMLYSVRMSASATSAVITGASRGIGLSIANALGREGVRVLLVARNDDALQSAKHSLTKDGIAVHTFSADVTKEDDVRALLQRAEAEFGRVDVLVNNAGGAASLPFS